MDNAAVEIKFGTDGWRAVIADTYTLENVRILSQAVADFLGTGKKIAVGFDTRFMSDKFALASAIVFKSNGIEAVLSDRPIPTPALSFAVKSRKLDLGIMITASHNPAEYNGYKIKNSAGGGASQELTREAEKLLLANPVKDSASPESVEVVDLTRDYIKFIRNYIDLKKIRNKKFKVLVDSMYGSGDSFIAQVLKGTNIKLEFMRNTINPSFGGGRPEPVEDNLKELKERV
ncbi:MAG: phosphoglucomutase/phosphomannomutase family protein, partial [Candidatus Omnitrophica bacterium]|nr:phosphoglucomutase/phosphomannomutase family protein [Candidatus Omnitrophota bacterium]